MNGYVMNGYVRFQTSLRLTCSRTPLGVFHAAEKLLTSGDLDADSAAHARLTLSYFNDYLPVPRLRPEQPRAVFWFRQERHSMIQTLWGLVRLLRRAGLHTELLRVTNPGKICYEDEFQIAAIPWRQRRHRR